MAVEMRDRLSGCGEPMPPAGRSIYGFKFNTRYCRNSQFQVAALNVTNGHSAGTRQRQVNASD
jgi:hypothetical protein